MAQRRAQRSRPVIKSVAFSEDEWANVERRMRIVGKGAFSEFARSAILDGQIKVKQIAFDPRILGAELRRIGNNVNQIARSVNVQDEATLEQMRATRTLVSEIQSLVEEAVKRIE